LWVKHHKCGGNALWEGDPDEDIETMEIAGGFDDDLRQILQD